MSILSQVALVQFLVLGEIQGSGKQVDSRAEIEDACVAFTNVAGVTIQRADLSETKVTYVLKQVNSKWIVIEETKVSITSDVNLNETTHGIPQTTKKILDSKWSYLESIVIEKEPNTSTGFSLHWKFKADSVLEISKILSSMDILKRPNYPQSYDVDRQISDYKIMFRSKFSVIRFLERFEPVLKASRPDILIDRKIVE